MSRNNYLLSKDGTRLLCGCKASVIPDGVTCIDGGAFNGCSGLKFIKIPDSVTSIGNCAFEGCSDLQSVRIPNGVIKIGYDAFRGCRSLQSIEIPSSVTSIGRGVFHGCVALQSIEVAQDNENFMSRSNCLLSKDGTILLHGCETSVIPDSVTEIDGDAFRGCCSLQSIEIPSNVADI